jgi:hypothetical protein
MLATRSTIDESTLDRTVNCRAFLARLWRLLLPCTLSLPARAHAFSFKIQKLIWNRTSRLRNFGIPITIRIFIRSAPNSRTQQSCVCRGLAQARLNYAPQLDNYRIVPCSTIIEFAYAHMLATRSTVNGTIIIWETWPRCAYSSNIQCTTNPPKLHSFSIIFYSIRASQLALCIENRGLWTSL